MVGFWDLYKQNRVTGLLSKLGVLTFCKCLSNQGYFLIIFVSHLEETLQSKNMGKESDFSKKTMFTLA